MMKNIFVVICLLLLSTTAFSQTRSRTTTKRPAQTAKTTKTPADQAAAEVRNIGAEKVANQIKNLTTFLYLLGGVAKRIEENDVAARSNQGSPAVLQQNEQNKAKLRSTFQDFRVGLDQLEVYFRSTPELQGYYVKVVGSASGAADAEARAAAGQFDQAGRTLLGVVSRLTDVLVVMK
jgi:hypothetical protein